MDIKEKYIDVILTHLVNLDFMGEPQSDILEARAKMFLSRSHEYLAYSHCLRFSKEHRDRAFVCAEAATYYFREARYCRLMGD